PCPEHRTVRPFPVGSRLVLDNISVTRADSTGIALDGDYNILSNSVANYNGQLGIIARGRYVKLINNEMLFESRSSTVFSSKSRVSATGASLNSIIVYRRL
ncbi:MAG: hypothetical protein ACREV2_16605, partial [Burkholderiales bacterium]